MIFYLSSYLLGNEIKYLKSEVYKFPKIAYIPNAQDVVDANLEKINQTNKINIKSLEDLGFEVEILDLKDHFNLPGNLKAKLSEFNGVFVRGGNVFALRQAMKLSGFDNILKEYNQNNNNFLYAGYSAGICVLAPNLKGIELVDSTTNSTHLHKAILIFEGLGILDFAIAPHYKSNHPESYLIDNLVNYYIENKILFKALKDGEVLIIE